jgi:hypothetical protein
MPRAGVEEEGGQRACRKSPHSHVRLAQEMQQALRPQVRCGRTQKQKAAMQRGNWRHAANVKSLALNEGQFASVVREVPRVDGAGASALSC